MNLKSNILASPLRNKSIRFWLVLGFAIFATLQVTIAFQKPTGDSSKPQGSSLDTFVPLGFTLVPIQIENHIELQSLIDQFAIVDLHKKGVSGIVASGVRLLRSPRNPEVFGVLIEQDRARELISKYGAQFTVTLKSPNSRPEKENPKRKIVKE